MERELRTIEFWRGRLPHWELHGASYFVTIHLKGAIPGTALRQLREKLLAAVGDRDNEVARRQYFANLERHLEDAPATRDLEEPEIATAIKEAIEAPIRNGSWEMIAYVMMPNHLHLFFRTERRLRGLLMDFKRWTGREARRLQGRQGPFWQHEWFDHWSRSAEQDARIVRYIEKNPVKAGLVGRVEDWPHTYVRPSK